MLDIDNGARFETYVIAGGPGDVILNGAAARLVHPGDRVIVITYAQYDEAELEAYAPEGRARRLAQPSRPTRSSRRSTASCTNSLRSDSGGGPVDCSGCLSRSTCSCWAAASPACRPRCTPHGRAGRSSSSRRASCATRPRSTRRGASPRRARRPADDSPELHLADTHRRRRRSVRPRRRPGARHRGPRPGARAHRHGRGVRPHRRRRGRRRSPWRGKAGTPSPASCTPAATPPAPRSSGRWSPRSSPRRATVRERWLALDLLVEARPLPSACVARGPDGELDRGPRPPHRARDRRRRAVLRRHHQPAACRRATASRWRCGRAWRSPTSSSCSSTRPRSTTPRCPARCCPRRCGARARCCATSRARRSWPTSTRSAISRRATSSPGAIARRLDDRGIDHLWLDATVDRRLRGALPDDLARVPARSGSTPAPTGCRSRPPRTTCAAASAPTSTARPTLPGLWAVRRGRVLGRARREPARVELAARRPRVRAPRGRRDRRGQGRARAPPVCCATSLAIARAAPSPTHRRCRPAARRRRRGPAGHDPRRRRPARRRPASSGRPRSSSDMADRRSRRSGTSSTVGERARRGRDRRARSRAARTRASTIPSTDAAFARPASSPARPTHAVRPPLRTAGDRGVSDLRPARRRSCATSSRAPLAEDVGHARRPHVARGHPRRRPVGRAASSPGATVCSRARPRPRRRSGSSIPTSGRLGARTTAPPSRAGHASSPRWRAALRSLLTGERTALNLLCHCSGVATLTRRYVDAVQGSRARDPRHPQDAARAPRAREGGGARRRRVNHRESLSDAVLIKDNHLVVPAHRARRSSAPATAGPGRVVEVECDTLEQVAEAVDGGTRPRPARQHDAGAGGRGAWPSCRAPAPVEVSGGVTLETSREYAEAGRRLHLRRRASPTPRRRSTSASISIMVSEGTRTHAARHRRRQHPDRHRALRRRRARRPLAHRDRRRAHRGRARADDPAVPRLPRLLVRRPGDRRRDRVGRPARDGGAAAHDAAVLRVRGARDRARRPHRHADPLRQPEGGRRRPHRQRGRRVRPLRRPVDRRRLRHRQHDRRDQRQGRVPRRRDLPRHRDLDGRALRPGGGAAPGRARAARRTSSASRRSSRSSRVRSTGSPGRSTRSSTGSRTSSASARSSPPAGWPS